MSGGKGNEGQANYGLANSTLERVCEQRRRDGFPGLAIQWGAIGDVGVVQETMGLGHAQSPIVIAGTVPQPISSCLKILEKFLYFQDQVPSGTGVVSCFIPEKSDSNDTESKSKSKLKSNTLSNSVLKIFGLDEAALGLRGEASLGQLGMDSLMLVEMKQLLERNGHAALSNTEIRLLTWNKIKELERKAEM